MSDSSDPVPRQAHAAAVSANQMYIHGGHTVSGQMLGDLLIFHVGAGNIKRCKFAGDPKFSVRHIQLLLSPLLARLGICYLQK